MYKALKIRNIHAYCDSQLVASQYTGERMDSYLKLVQNLAQNLYQFALTRIPRAENAQANALASSSDPGLSRVIPVEFIEHPSIRPPVIINMIDSPDGDPEKIDLQAT